MPLPPALHVCGIEPDVGHREISQGTLQQLLDIGVEAPGDAAHLVLGEPLYAHPLGYPLDLPRARAGLVHLRDGGYERPVRPLVALEDVVRKEAPLPEPGDPEVEGADARVERPRPVSVPAVAGCRAHLLGLHVHHGIYDRLRQLAEELLQVDAPVRELRHLSCRGRAHGLLCYAVHWASVLSTNL